MLALRLPPEMGGALGRLGAEDRPYQELLRQKGDHRILAGLKEYYLLALTRLEKNSPRISLVEVVDLSSADDGFRQRIKEEGILWSA